MNQQDGAKCLTVLYDGACPLCSREIDWYRQKTADETIDWVDVSADTTATLPGGIEHAAALRRFHVIQPDGSVSSGAAAFVRLWQAFPGLRRAAGLLSGAMPLAVLESGYRMFLPVRPLLARLLPRRSRPPEGKT